MKRKFFSGSTLDQAVMMAARHYEIDPQELAYRQIEKRHGFLRTRKAVMIAVDPEQPRREPADAAAAPPEAKASAPPTRPEPSAASAERPPVSLSEFASEAADEPAAWATDESEDVGELDDEDESDEEDERDDDREIVDGREDGRGAKVEQREVADRGAGGPEGRERPEGGTREPEPNRLEGDDEILEAAVRASHTLLRFAGIDAEATARATTERIEVEIEGPDESVLVVEGGKGLLSIQHLLPRMVRGLTGRTSFVRVDSDGFHEQRKKRLEALALKEADAASRSASPRTLPPMAPDERRIIHLALKDSLTVVTESRGTGLHKRVVIRPADGFDEPGDVEARHGF